MPILYVAISKTMQEWGADVGLGKNLFKIGVADCQTPDEAVAGAGGQDDWKVLKTAEVDFGEDDALARLGRKEKLVDPNYYPKLRGAQGVVKVNLAAVENSRLVALALEGKQPPKTKAKPADIATYLINNTLR
jgi:hypothetical protein